MCAIHFHTFSLTKHRDCVSVVLFRGKTSQGMFEVFFFSSFPNTNTQATTRHFNQFRENKSIHYSQKQHLAGLKQYIIISF